MTKIIEPNYQIIQNIVDLKVLERIGRVCYESEHLITEDSHVRFLCKILDNKHESVLEHSLITVLFTIDRAQANQLVRHRLASFAQKSGRYTKEAELQLIKPFGYDQWADDVKMEWVCSCEQSHMSYLHLLKTMKSEIARGVLPHDIATRIYVSANVRQWRHILKLRCDKHAHPQIRQLCISLLTELKELNKIVFDDITF